MPPLSSRLLLPLTLDSLWGFPRADVEAFAAHQSEAAESVAYLASLRASLAEGLGADSQVPLVALSAPPARMPFACLLLSRPEAFEGSNGVL